MEPATLQPPGVLDGPPTTEIPGQGSVSYMSEHSLSNKMPGYGP